MAVDLCNRCSKSLGTLTQEALPGSGVEKLCISCETHTRAVNMLKLMATPEDNEWEDLTDWERDFLTSVRRQANDPSRTLSEKQFLVVERIYRKG